MPRPIILTDAIKKQMKKEFSAALEKNRIIEGKFSYSRNLEYEKSSIIISLSETAYRKTLALLNAFSDEAGWHGTVSRPADKEFIIEDIFVYPQEVTGSTVNTNQKAYTEWLYKLDDETFKKIRMHGHSHVNMGVSPSGVDENHREKILEQLDADMFYIFMVWNKLLSVNAIVYDMKRNVLYENSDIEIKLPESKDMEKFLADAKSKVKSKAAAKGKSENFPYTKSYGYYDMGGDLWGY